jgi:hypothetical protein
LSFGAARSIGDTASLFLDFLLMRSHLRKRLLQKTQRRHSQAAMWHNDSDADISGDTIGSSLPP